MTSVSIKDAKNRLSELARRVEGGDTVIVTRNGKPIMELVPHRPNGGLNLEAGRDYKRKLGVRQFFGPIPDDFDDPFPEDFLLRPLPE